MIAEQPVLHNVLILADESASWRVAGLPQLQRILLSLNEYAATSGQAAPVSVCVSWKPGTPAASRLVVEDPRLSRLEVSDCEAEEASFDLVLSTHVFLYRNGIAAILEAGALADHVTGVTWHERLQDVRRTLRWSADRAAQTAWQYVPDPAAIPAIERAFLRENGKSQDGLVSRYLNRPISRSISPATCSSRSVSASAWPCTRCPRSACRGSTLRKASPRLRA